MSVAKLGTWVFRTALFVWLHTGGRICCWNILLKKRCDSRSRNPAGSGNTADSILVVVVVLVAVCATILHDGSFSFFITFGRKLGRRFSSGVRRVCVRNRIGGRWISLPRFAHHGIHPSGRHACATGASDVVNGAYSRGAGSSIRRASVRATLLFRGVEEGKWITEVLLKFLDVHRPCLPKFGDC